MVRGTDDIEESLRMLIGTRLGERVMLPLYGTPLETFSAMTVTAVNNIKTQVREAIIRYEPRVDVLSVDVRTPEGGRDGELLVIVDYDVPAVNNRANMVFPFYLKEGNLVRIRPASDDSTGGGDAADGAGGGAG